MKIKIATQLNYQVTILLLLQLRNKVLNPYRHKNIA
jgi:hypothetical protein